MPDAKAFRLDTLWTKGMTDAAYPLKGVGISGNHPPQLVIHSSSEFQVQGRAHLRVPLVGQVDISTVERIYGFGFERGPEEDLRRPRSSLLSVKNDTLLCYTPQRQVAHGNRES